MPNSENKIVNCETCYYKNHPYCAHVKKCIPIHEGIDGKFCAEFKPKDTEDRYL